MNPFFVVILQRIIFQVCEMMIVMTSRKQEFVTFFAIYFILVIWISFQVSVAVLKDNFLAARCIE